MNLPEPKPSQTEQRTGSSFNKVRPRSMSTCIASFLLLASGVILSFVCLVVAWIIPQVFFWLYRPKSFYEVRELMPAVTRIATDFSWLFAVLIAAVSLAGVVYLWRLSDRVVECITAGLCAQGLITWTAMFCFFFDGFTGPMCMHHGPEFEFPQFVSLGFGVFPVTLLLVVAPLIMALWPRAIAKT